MAAPATPRPGAQRPGSRRMPPQQPCSSSKFVDQDGSEDALSAGGVSRSLRFRSVGLSGYDSHSAGSGLPIIKRKGRARARLPGERYVSRLRSYAESVLYAVGVAHECRRQYYGTLRV